jgi:hypothetical protein
VAEIDVISVGLENGLHFIFIDGPIELGDGYLFLQRTLDITKAVVFLRSPGGNVEAGVSIGGQISAKGFSTAVTPEMRCASAAALAWLGGARRYMEPTSLIGFHASSILQADNSRAVSSTGNAVIGGYLADLGLSRSAIRFITSTPPDDILWLTLEDAQKHGIEVLQMDNIAPACNDDELLTSAVRTAVAAAKRLQKNYQASGMARIRIDINDLYKHAASTQGMSDALEVYVLDWMASEFDAAYMKAAFKREQIDDRNKMEHMRSRINALLIHNGLSASARSELIADWEHSANFAMREFWGVLLTKDDHAV